MKDAVFHELEGSSAANVESLGREEVAMDWDQIRGRWEGVRAKAKRRLEKLTHEVRRDQPKTKDQTASRSRETPHVKHFEDMH